MWVGVGVFLCMYVCVCVYVCTHTCVCQYYGNCCSHVDIFDYDYLRMCSRSCLSVCLWVLWLTLYIDSFSRNDQMNKEYLFLFSLQLMSPSNVAVYGSLCALASFDRQDLHQTVILNT